MNRLSILLFFAALASLVGTARAFTPRPALSSAARVGSTQLLATNRINESIDLESEKVVHTEKLEAGKKCVYCRCWKSSKFPLCDGSHVKHNKETGDNVGPLIVQT